MVEGLVIKAIGGFYYVKKGNGEVVECRARGRFRKENINIYVGDRVLVNNPDSKTWVVEAVLQRKNLMVRPPIANIDQCILVFSIKNPDFNPFLLDRFLVLAEHLQVNIVICLNKIDLADNKEELENIKEKYNKIGYKVLTISAVEKIGIEPFKAILIDKISVLAGPSGVGKSTLLNIIQPGLSLKTGELSEKLRRGRHTTRHVELIELEFGGLIADTPGFSYLELDDISPDQLPYLFPEIKRAQGKCKFKGCRHFHEPDCEIKKLMDQCLIYSERYESYIAFLNEICDKRRNLQ